MTNKQLAEEILQKVGGKKNINSYSHCSTRLRFDLKDKNSIDKAALERTDGILQVMEVAGQTQVVIGSNVQYVYDELATLLPQGNTSSEKSDGKKKGVFGSALELISSLFTPLIDVLIGAGILKGLLSILTATNLLTDASGTYQILNAAADSLYYFLPIVIAITCSKKLKTNMFVSVTIAGALLYPNLTALYDAGTAITFLGIPVHLTAFKSSVFPIIFAIVLLSFVEKGLKKILPDSIRSRIAASDWLPLNLPITIISTALNISCKIPDNINGNENEISLSIIVPLHISISYLLRFIVELIALLKHLFYTVIVQENPFLCKYFNLIY